LKIIDWESFRPIIALALIRERKSNAGRRPFDSVMLFKTIVLQRLYNLSDDQTEFQINDRMSFMRFLGLSLDDKVPDAKTIWLFKDTLTKAGIMDQLFSQFNRMLEERGIITHKGTIVDATFVDVPR
jgi:transposase